MGERSVAGQGVECSLSAPDLGGAAAPSHFPLGPLLAFQAAEFSIVNLETENKPARRDGNRSRSAPGACSGKAPPTKPRPPRTPPPPLCPSQVEIWGPMARTLERVDFPVAESPPGQKAESGEGSSGASLKDIFLF